MTTINIKSRDAGRIIGKKGATVKSVVQESGAHVRVVQEGRPQVCMLFILFPFWNEKQISSTCKLAFYEIVLNYRIHSESMFCLKRFSSIAPSSLCPL